MSNQFSKYVCWTAKNSHETIFVDAASPSPAVFLATHQPMRLMRRPLRGTGGSALVTEEDMLNDFLPARREDDFPSHHRRRPEQASRTSFDGSTCASMAPQMPNDASSTCRNMEPH